MAQPKAKGSILFEIIIVVLILVLVGSIVYPKKLSDKEIRNTELARFRMDQLHKAGLQYQKYNGSYTDTLSKIINFVRTSPVYAHYVDSVIVGGLDSILTKLNEFEETQNAIEQLIPQATDSVMIDSIVQMQDDIKFESRQLAGYVEYVHDRMKSLPNMPMEDLKAGFLIVDSKKFTLDMDIVKNSVMNGELQVAMQGCNDVLAVIDRVAKQINKAKQHVPEYKNEQLDLFGYCPTTGEPLELVHLDTSVIKYFNIYCPIDSTDIEQVNNDFLKSTIGGLKIQNHGKIESGEKSWETE